MCEPHHSIVQYQVSDDPSDEPGVPPGMSGRSEGFLRAGLGKIFDWGKKIGSWFHFSNLGSGHTESIEWARTKALHLPRDTRYETQWWNRTVHLDGAYNGMYPIHGRFSMDRMEDILSKEDALKAATNYAHTVAIGDIQKFRRFFETSIAKSDRPQLYISNFMELMLTAEGLGDAYKRIRRIWGRKSIALFGKQKEEAKQICSLLLGYTRKRNLLVPTWADDNRLWTV